MNVTAKLISFLLIIFAGCSVDVHDIPLLKEESTVNPETQIISAHPTNIPKIEEIVHLPPAAIRPPQWAFPSGSGGNNTSSIGCHDADLDGICDEDDKCEGFDDRIDADLDDSPDRCDCSPENPDVYRGSPCEGSSECLILTCDPQGSGQCLTSVADQGTVCFDPQAPLDSCTMVDSVCDGQGTCVSEVIDDGCCCKGCDLGIAQFSGTQDDWFDIETSPYPIGVLLSQNENNGTTRGGVTLTPTGLQIDQEGTYSASINATVLYRIVEEVPYTPLIPVFLVRNGIFDPINIVPEVAAIGSTPFGIITSLQGTGFLMDVAAGTAFSLIATNGGSPQPETITVISWSISVYKICD